MDKIWDDLFSFHKISKKYKFFPEVCMECVTDSGGSPNKQVTPLGVICPNTGMRMPWESVTWPNWYSCPRRDHHEAVRVAQKLMEK